MILYFRDLGNQRTTAYEKRNFDEKFSKKINFAAEIRYLGYFDNLYDVKAHFHLAFFTKNFFPNERKIIRK